MNGSGYSLNSYPSLLLLVFFNIKLSVIIIVILFDMNLGIWSCSRYIKNWLKMTIKTFFLTHKNHCIQDHALEPWKVWIDIQKMMCYLDLKMTIGYVNNIRKLICYSGLKNDDWITKWLVAPEDPFCLYSSIALNHIVPFRYSEIIN